MKYLKSCLVLLFLLGASAAWGAPDRGQELFGAFLRNLAPEKAYFQLSSAPRENGYIPWGYLECVNADVRGMRIRSLRMDCFDAQVTPPAQWAGMEHPRVDSMLACHAEATFTEDDVNDFLRRHVFGHEKEWQNVRVKMSAGRINATAYYRANLRLMRLRVRLDLSCRIVGRGTALWLEDIRLKVNNQEVSSGTVERALQKLQPFIDMKKYNLPLYLSKVEFRDGQCSVHSRILPKPLPGGLRWDYAASPPEKGAAEKRAS